ncbi:hypothetical protein F5Y06DRAFT_276990 [Hypoxylon sp. FL0890]|nr:hypothetical protein F5Y06DRAFT_276990 [Hypoxylon sp. FL0890]
MQKKAVDDQLRVHEQVTHSLQSQIKDKDREIQELKERLRKAESRQEDHVDNEEDIPMADQSENGVGSINEVNLGLAQAAPGFGDQQNQGTFPATADHVHNNPFAMMDNSSFLGMLDDSSLHPSTMNTASQSGQLRGNNLYGSQQPFSSDPVSHPWPGNQTTFHNQAMQQGSFQEQAEPQVTYGMMAQMSSQYPPLQPAEQRPESGMMDQMSSQLPLLQTEEQQAESGMMDQMMPDQFPLQLDNSSVEEEVSPATNASPTPSVVGENTAAQVAPTEQQQCNICGSVHPHHDALRRHQRRVHNVQNTHNRRRPGAYPCDFCDETYGTAQLRRMHVQRIHDPNSSYQRKLRPVKGGILCPYGCGKLLSSEKMLDNHKSAMHRDVGK